MLVTLYIYIQLTGSQSSRESSLSAMNLSVEGYFFFPFIFIFFLQMIARENEGRKAKEEKENPPKEEKKKKTSHDNLAVASELHPI